MAEPAIGAVLGGKYVVERVLGRGGMGVVVAARHRALDQRVAIKCLLPEALGAPHVVERFAREARAAAKIQGEHVARVLDVGEFDDGMPFIVMEHLQGHDLAVELVQRGALPADEAVRHVLETCEAVAQAHALRMVHRDLKPSNLFLAEQPGRRPIVKVLDFGISKIIDPTSQQITQTTNVLGTPLYMSPEQLISSKNVDERSDIWSLGVILYELVAGAPPFTGDTVPEVVAKIMRTTVEPLARVRPDLPPGLDDVVARCLRADVAERFANVAQLAEALLPFGEPADRDTVQAIARVLGVGDAGGAQRRAAGGRGNAISFAPTAVAADAGGAAPAAQARAVDAPGASAVASASSAAHTAGGAALSTPTTSPSRRPLMGGLVAAVAVVGVGVAALVVRGRTAPPPLTTSRAQAAALSEPASPSATPEALAPMRSMAAAPNALETAAGTSAPAPARSFAPARPVAPATTARGAVSSRPALREPPAAAPGAARPAAKSAARPASPGPSTPSTSAPSNPLDLPIK